MACIYGLVDPRDNKVFYVGQTKKEPKARFKEHLRDVNEKHSYKNHKILQINNSNLKPYYIILEWLYSSDFKFIDKQESYWIKHYKLLNKLTNIQNGGTGGNGFGNGLKGEKVYLSKLTQKDVLEIIDLYKYTNMNCKQIASYYNVCGCCINSIVNGKNWKHITGGIKTKSIYKKVTGLSRDKNPMAKLNDEAISDIVFLRTNGFTLNKISQIYGVSVGTISEICLGKTWNGLSKKLNIKIIQKNNKNNAKLNKEDVLNIRNLLTIKTQKEISKLYNVSQSTIHRIKHKITWGDI